MPIQILKAIFQDSKEFGLDVQTEFLGKAVITSPLYKAGESAYDTLS